MVGSQSKWSEDGTGEGAPVLEGSINLAHWAPSIDPFATWIDRQDFQSAKHWAERLTSSTSEHVEGAVAEAVAWDWLSHRVEELDLVRAGAEASPDFHCRVRGMQFFVEVANISRQAMTDETRMRDTVFHRGTLNPPFDLLHRVILNKVRQGAGLRAPYLVLVTTLHWNASILMTDELLLQSLLHSRPRLAMEFDPKTGQGVGPIRQEADFERAAFTKSRSDVLARSSVSGVLFGSFGLYPTQSHPARSRTDLVRGILHPQPDYRFDPGLLPDVAFGRFKSWPLRDRVEVEWSRT